ncbi:MAG TPA: cysteine hydrolase [Streptosporangiaceae bacterium]|nr:cysteine hydrolase [Streptosporangiaceae bacterium]
MTERVIVPNRTALINVDLQNAFVANVVDGLELMKRINDLAQACRAAGIMIIHTSHVLRADGSNLGLLRRIPKIRDGALNAGTVSAALHDDLDVRPGDVLLQKPRFGAFYDTDLELILRSNGIDTIIMSGISGLLRHDRPRSTCPRLRRSLPLRRHRLHGPGRRSGSSGHPGRSRWPFRPSRYRGRDAADCCGIGHADVGEDGVPAGRMAVQG